MGRIGNRASGIVTLAAVLAVAGCTAQYRNHGYVPDEAVLSQVTVGVDTRETVRDVIGTPTTQGMLENGDFYYVRSRVRQYAWQRPRVVERTVMAMDFDDAGILRNIETYGLEDGRVVRLEQRVTGSSTADKTFIRQLLGNLGQFNAESVLGGE